MVLQKWQVVISNIVFWLAQGYLCYWHPVAWLTGMTALYFAGGLKFNIRTGKDDRA